MSSNIVASTKLIVILGPTAVGKTNLAVQLALKIKGEIISADSRQVYRGMDLGTGKDLDEYEVNGNQIPFHLIDILEAGQTYNLFDFQRDFYTAHDSILERDKIPILCGGTGLYLEAALSDKRLLEVPINEELREELKNKSQDDLNEKLLAISESIHNTTDTLDRERTIRAIEIESFKKQYIAEDSPIKNFIVFGIKADREIIKRRIELRLKERLTSGMIEEVKVLLDSGVSLERLNYYGLEYKFIGNYLSGLINYDEMYTKLLQAIQRFAKKQMTWFRRMEKRGVEIHWIDGELNLEEKLNKIKAELK